MESPYQKKIEKISQAIYLVTNHIKDNEPLKWELRKESIGFLSCTRSLAEDGNGENIPADLVIDALAGYARDLTSLLSLAIVSGLISRTNGGIILSEIQSIITSFQAVASAHTARAGFILSHEFFATDPEMQEQLMFGNSKGQKPALSDNSNKNAATSSAKIESKSEEKVKDKKNTRQSLILELLKSRSNLTIKDFSLIISDCSEKTIQRELLDLVEKGVVKKEGERRWSTYSLR